MTKYESYKTKMSNKPKVKNVVIVGGGTSGWMCAAAIARTAPPHTNITLIESEDIGVIGVGEATIPTLLEFNDFLGLQENDVLRECQGTFKLGIDFIDWYKKGQSYFHPFALYGRDTPEFSFHQLWLRLKQISTDTAGDIDAYNIGTAAAYLERFSLQQGGANAILSTIRHAYHIDSKKYGQMLRRYAQNKGVKRIEEMVVNVDQNPATGDIQSVTLKDNQIVAGELFIDCSGFKALLIDGVMQSKFVDWSHYLPCDRAIALQTKLTAPPAPYTKATADLAGWRWRIPLQERAGNGHVYSSQFMQHDQALERLVNHAEGKALTEPLPLQFCTGHRQKFWGRNCVAIGLAGGFIEPLESTSIHLAQMGIQELINLWPGRGCNDAEIAHYNHMMTEDYEKIRDFIILHYKTTQREDTPFWRYVKNMPIPDTLSAKIETFQHSGRIFTAPRDLFKTHSWLSVLVGQGIVPKHYEAAIDRIPENALIQNMQHLKEAVNKTALALPTHEAHINRICSNN
ncbi:tryptophan 7-halogenase [Paraglaciecola aquimarina]|uniref:Tryptophan 7-halogenase n=1 Tax=Paraglaciecola algarum TaxID=3050085 RepID=A0ABS9DC61_9ALTE|nr:tryptophan halogenase family protein [Paraglaciecola sp. G1-23]MCF2949612.1 tryptophan 7-halogenase [Paraglaciecola sp. G1-23]